ncbi:MAG: hypothetical protein DRR06_13825 [Gammaproteobacteria bacterium]|nr:MAG: hypothetical protein DRR06_13825 [Gammaproteobacteria bacterium]
MNKKALVEAAMKLNETPSISALDMEESLDCILNAIQGEISNGGKVELKNFGSFGTKVRAARAGRNPQTGEKIQIAEKKVAYCKLSKSILGGK